MFPYSGPPRIVAQFPEVSLFLLNQGSSLKGMNEPTKLDLSLSLSLALSLSLSLALSLTRSLALYLSLSLSLSISLSLSLSLALYVLLRVDISTHHHEAGGVSQRGLRFLWGIRTKPSTANFSHQDVTSLLMASRC